MKKTTFATLGAAGLLLGAAGLLAVNTSVGRAAGHKDDPMFQFMHSALSCLDSAMMEANDNVGGQYGQYLRNQYMACLNK